MNTCSFFQLQRSLNERGMTLRSSYKRDARFRACISRRSLPDFNDSTVRLVAPLRLGELHLQLENRTSTLASGLINNVQYPERIVRGARHEDARIRRSNSHLYACVRENVRWSEKAARTHDVLTVQQWSLARGGWEDFGGPPHGNLGRTFNYFRVSIYRYVIRTTLGLFV